MKLIYKNNSYSCRWKTQMRKNFWYGMEPVKFSFIMPEKIYKEILDDIKTDITNNSLLDIFQFKLIKNKNEKLYFKKSVDLDFEIWDIQSYLESSTISSKFNNGNVKVNFNLHIFDNDKLDISDHREIMINQILEQ